MQLTHPINAAQPDGRHLALVMEAAISGGGLVVCSWCHVWLRVNRELPRGSVSHGVCPACEARMMREAEAFLPAKGVFSSASAALAPAVSPAPAASSCVGLGAASPARPTLHLSAEVVRE